ncbi:protein strawberry notch-like isoform X3 [Zophobas morio]|uniref:protein strawberry notch-like isoform X3 n=1 Tax=Zophobas morio TaxID=2755281 RepID=UPI0030832990
MKPPMHRKKKIGKPLEQTTFHGTLTKPGGEELDGSVDDEELGVAETYADYMPSKLKLGKKHPDPVVETTSLSSVAPADISYELSLPAATIDSGALSALQLESVTYACQAHENILPDGTRAGFLVGDGAGVGKGRTIAGVIFENYLKGRVKAIWVSVSTDLKYDAERDLSDIGADSIEVHQLNKFKYGTISTSARPVREGVMFSTYSALIGKSNVNGVCKTRLDQLLEWCGKDFDGVVVFDECHRAKNLCPEGALNLDKKETKEKKKPTKTGLAVLGLQMSLPKARVVYASATGASEPRNMAYMARLGLWGKGTSFATFDNFIAAVEKRGVGAMEIVAMDMKLRGTYIARQLSFHGVTFRIEEIPLTKEFEDVYNASTQVWVEAMVKFEEASRLIVMDGVQKQIMWRLFWSAHQRFFKYLCIAAKVRQAVTIAHEAIESGKCVVIGLQSTGEARTLDQLEKDDGELSDFVSTPKAVFENLVETQFPSLGGKENRKLEKHKLPKNLFKLKKDPDDDENPSKILGKRKVRQSARVTAKRMKISMEKEIPQNRSKYVLSDDDSDEEINSPNDSDFSANEISEGDSGSDTDLWEVRGTKSKGKTTVKEEPQDDTDSKLIKLEDIKTEKEEPQEKTSYFMSSVRDVAAMKETLLQEIEHLGKKLPPNTLDQLIHELGGAQVVAEMTGRKGRVVHTENGDVQYESRAETGVSLEALNMTEKQRFMDGEKNIAIISEAASTGISLQSDRRVKNQKRRVHITLELPWSADRAIQQFGRTHRSNQMNAPEYVFLITNLAGERRFASIVAKRLESLGALTHGDRRATETRDLSQFNFDNKYGREALQLTLNAVKGDDFPLVPPPADYQGDFFKDVYNAAVGIGLLKDIENMGLRLTFHLPKQNVSMAKFLNRILGLPVDLQNRLFRYFTDTLDAIISREKRLGRYDAGIQDLGTGGEVVKRIRTVTFMQKHAIGTAPVELHTFHVERGISWSQVLAKIAKLAKSDYAFYVSRSLLNNHHSVRLVVAVEPAASKETERKSDRLFFVYKPNTGLQFKKERLADLEMMNRKVGVEEAEVIWKNMFDAFLNTCAHEYWKGSCATRKVGFHCEVGMTRRTYYVLAGSVLGVWGKIEEVLKNLYFRMQVIRLKTEDNLKVIGLFMPRNYVEPLIEAFSESAEDVNYAHFIA